MSTKGARQLRKNSTDAERRLWRAIRDRQLDGAKFRRQTPLPPYVGDFVCFEHRLVIELDGGQHAEQERQDRRRTVVLAGRGYRVLRFWNNEVMKNLDGVLESIRLTLKR